MMNTYKDKVEVNAIANRMEVKRSSGEFSRIKTLII